ncbi:MAG: DUF350 domain-containing protein [Chloroflexota bacterium]
MKRKALLLTPILVLLMPTIAYAQEITRAEAHDLTFEAFISTLLYGLIGILLCVAGYFAFDRFAGLDLQRELVEDQNTAIGIMLAGAFVGIAMVVSAVIS